MRVVIIVCLAALAFGQPVEKNAREDIIQKNTYKGPEPHSVEKRDAEEDCSQLSGDARKTCEEKVAANSRQKRELPDLNNASAMQDENVQVAYSEEGTIAKQSEGGQYVYASDFGGLVAQIMQHAYQAKCCWCGCSCDCDSQPEPEPEPET